MGDVKKRINIKTIFTQEGLKQWKKNLTDVNDAFKAPLSKMKEMQTSTGGWNKRMKGARTGVGRMALGLRKGAHGMRGFKMEMLGVMFFGMAMKKMFSGLLKTSLEWTGIMELLSLTLGVLFLPVALQLLEIFMPIFEWFMNLSDAAKLFIGWVVVLGAILGGALMIFGMLALGIGSIILALGFFLVPIIMVGIALAGIGIILVGLVVIIDNWGKSTSKVIMGIGIVLIGLGVILFLFIGWWALIPIAVGIAIALIAGNWEWFRDFMKILWMTIKHLTIIAWAGIKNIVIQTWNAIVWYVENSVNSMIATINTLIGWLNKVPGVNIPMIPTLDLSSIKGELTNMTDLANKLASERLAEGAKLAAARNAKKLAAEAEASATDAGTNSFLSDVIPEQFSVNKNDNESSAESYKLEPNSVTNNFYGFTNNDLIKELDDRDSKMASQMERNR